MYGFAGLLRAHGSFYGAAVLLKIITCGTRK
jgi:hypothetical protein